MIFKLFRKANTILIYIILFFIFFECLIGRSIYNNIVSSRTICYILLSISTLFIFQRGYKIYNDKSLITFFLYYSAIGIIHLSFIGSGAKYFLYPFLVPLFVCIFTNIQTISNLSLDKIKKTLIYIAAIFVVINITLYFLDLPIWEKSRPWGRITRGYSTVDVVTLNLTLLLLLVDKSINLAFSRRLVLTFIIIIGIIVQASGSGTVYFTIVIISSIYLCYKIKKDIFFKQIKKTLSILIISVTTFFSIAFVYISINYPSVTEGFTYTMSNRILVILGNTKDTDINTMEIRDVQKEKANKTFIKDDIDYLFGIGFNSMSLTEKTTQTLYIEEQYALNKITIGFVGNALFLLFIICNLYRIRRLKELYSKIMYACFWIIFALSCKTIIPLNVFPIIVYFSLYYTLFYSDLKTLPYNTKL